MPVMENIRQGANSPVMKILFGIIVIVFVFWGIGGQNQTQIVAYVNGTRITDTQLSSELKRQLRGQAVPPEQQAMVEEQVIQRLIVDELKLQLADDMGLEVSDYEVALIISQIPAFKDEEGRYSKRLYDRYIKSQGVRDGKFKSGLRDSILVSKVSSVVASGVSVTDAEVRQAFDQQNTQLSIRWVLLSDDALKDDVVVGEDELAAYQSASEEAIRGRYDAEKARRWSQPRRFEYSTILLRTDLEEGAGKVDEAALRTRLEGILAEARSGADFAELARTHSEGVTAGMGGREGQLREDQIDAALAEALAAAGEGGVTDIVTSPRGLLIAKVTGVEPAKDTTFEEAKATIARELLAEQGLAAFREQLVSELLAEWNPGAPPTARLTALGLTVQDAGPFPPTQPRLVGAGSSPELEAALANIPEVGVLPKSYSSAAGPLLVEVTRVDAPSDVEFATQSAMLQRMLLQQKRQFFVQMWEQDALSRAKIERLYMPLEDG